MVSCDLSVVELEMKINPMTIYPGGSCYLVCETNCDPAPALTLSIQKKDKSILDFKQIEGVEYPVPSSAFWSALPAA